MRFARTVVAAVMALTTACAPETAPTGATPERGTTEATTGPATTAPATTETAPTEPSATGPEAGRTLYLQNCAGCHGVDLRGSAVGPSFLSIVYEPGHHPDSAFQVAVTRGVQPHHWDFGPMQPTPGLTETDVTAIVAYVRQVQQQEGFEPYPP